MELCKIDGCERPRRARGWCNAHWTRWRRHGDPLGGRQTIPIKPGTQFGRLTVIAQSATRSSGELRWLCQCQCGNQTIVGSQPLRNGMTKSCGCLTIETARLTHTKHGYARNEVNYVNGNKRHPLYNTWLNMRQRCNNSNSKQYPDYGGRGITVDPSWDNFMQFVQDMGERPTRYHSIERLDNDAGYNPNNCCWATRDEQMTNRRGLGIIGMKQLPEYLADCIQFISRHSDSLTLGMRTQLQALIT